MSVPSRWFRRIHDLIFLQNESGIEEVVNHNIIANHIAAILSSPHIPSRKVAIEILTFICFVREFSYHAIALSALDSCSSENNESGPYAYWLKSLESTLLGRGKMGSLVGASEEIRKNGGLDSSLNEYAVRVSSTNRQS